MDEVIGKIKNIREFILILVSVLLVSFHYFFVYFINSTYLKGVLNEKTVGYVYTAGAILNLILFLTAPKFLEKRGNFRLTVLLTIAEMLSLIGLAFVSTPLLIILFFIIHQAVVPLLLYCLDIFLENYSVVDDIGSIRGMQLTMLNLPPLITPLISGLILTKPDYWKIYLISATFLVPFLFIIVNYFRHFKDPMYPSLSSKEAFITFYNNKNIFDVFVDHFLLNLFYGWMVIYMPIYLHDHIGFDWSEIGLMFSIMLLPFVFFQIPIGRIEDKYHDEKQVLVLGFSIMAVATALIPFIQDENFVLWAALLFVTRIGASLVEVSSDSYFFRHVHVANAGFISFYRMTRSLPYLIVPAIVGLTLLFFDIQYIFFVLGAIMLLGVRYAMMLRN